MSLSTRPLQSNPFSRESPSSSLAEFHQPTKEPAMSKHVSRMKALITDARAGLSPAIGRDDALRTAGIADAVLDADPDSEGGERWSEAVPALLARIAGGYGDSATEGELMRCAQIADQYETTEGGADRQASGSEATQ